jgi:hypothetical protein
MKLKAIFFIFLLLFFVSVTATNVKAEVESKTIVYESKKYYQVHSKNKKVKTTEISYDEYEKKVKHKNKYENLDTYEEPLLTTMLLPIDEIDNGSGGGSGRFPLYVDPYGPDFNSTDVYCDNGNYFVCSGTALTEYSFTSLVTTVTLDPRERTGLHLYNELTWTGSPQYSLTDFMSIQYSEGFLSPDNSSIRATRTVFYDVLELDFWGNITSATPMELYEESEYLSNLEDFSKSATGIIWTISPVYRSYRVPDYQFYKIKLLDENQQECDNIRVTKTIYTLETDLDLLGSVTIYPSYESHIKLEFAGDFRHTYPGISTGTSLTLRGYFTEDKISGFLNVSLTPTTLVDHSRRNEIDIYFN